MSNILLVVVVLVVVMALSGGYVGYSHYGWTGYAPGISVGGLLLLVLLFVLLGRL